MQSYVANLPSALQSQVMELTRTVPLTTSVPSTIAQNYATITSILAKAHEVQLSAFEALQTVTNSVSTISLVNDLIQAEATIDFYSVLEVAATETNPISKASLLTQAAEASEIMLNIFNEEAFYSGNYPSLGGNIALLVVYSFFFALQVISGVFYHQWWFLTCWSAGLILEIIGYAGRIWSHENILNFNAFVMQLVCLTLAPCFLMAGIYYVIAQLTLIYGQKFSMLRPMHYSLIFIICDLISIILQAVGGGVAANELSLYQPTDVGSHIMVGGLAFQVFTIALFQFFWYLFLWKVYKSYKTFGDAEFNPNFVHIRERKLLIPFIFTVSFAVVLIFVRSIYRLVELAEGWSSSLAVDEIYFMILEALMISLSSCILSFISPGLAYGKASHIYIDKSLKASFAKNFDIHADKNKNKNRAEDEDEDENENNTEKEIGVDTESFDNEPEYIHNDEN